MSKNPKSKEAPQGKRQTIKAQRQKKQRQQRLFIILAVTGAALLVMALVLKPIIVDSTTPVGEITPIAPQEYPLADGAALGDESAPVLVEVFEDFQCPACQQYSLETEPQLIENYVATGKIRYVFRHFPFIDDQSFTKESDRAALASECAAEQGRFWDYHVIVYTNWDGENQGAYNDKRLGAFAESIGLDMEKFNACMRDERYQDKISQDLAAGRQYGATGTPSVFVNGVQVAPGYVPTFEQLSQAIQAALAGQ
jgi:protein-disulfide isomerase